MISCVHFIIYWKIPTFLRIICWLIGMILCWFSSEDDSNGQDESCMRAEMGLEWMLKPSSVSQITSSSQLDNLQENHSEEVHFTLCDFVIIFYILFECLNLCCVGQEGNQRNMHRILNTKESRCYSFYHPCIMFFHIGLTGCFCHHELILAIPLHIVYHVQKIK